MALVAVCLSGCGFRDGSEIHEAAHTMLALDQAGAEILCCAPNIEQTSVIDHLSGRPASEKRNVLVESARIARGNIVDVAQVDPAKIDALIFPGGYGAATTLCTFATDGPGCSVHSAVASLILAMADAGKPIGAACIAPVLLARVLGAKIPAQLTIGEDRAVAEAIEKMGCRHVDCHAGGHVTDKDHRIATTPAFMLESGLAEVFEGIQGMVGAVLRMAAQRPSHR